MKGHLELCALARTCANSPHSLEYGTATAFQSSITRSRREKCIETHIMMRLRGGAETHQTPTEHRTAGPVLCSRRKEHLKDNRRLFNFPSETLRIVFITFLSFSLRHSTSVKTRILPTSDLPPLFHHLCLSPAHAGVRTTQLCDR